MFGFVRPYEKELTKEQSETFKRYYCGVCKSMEQSFGHTARFTLTYDCTFLAAFLDGVTNSRTEEKKVRCVMSEKYAVAGKVIDYCGDVNMLLFYHKLSDDIFDDKSKKARLARAVLKRGYIKASERNMEINKVIKSNLEYLSLLERQLCSEPDVVADAFGKLLEGVVGYGCGMDKIPMAVGYNLGKYIYLADAVVDYSEDMKSGAYNCFYQKYGAVDNIKEKVAFLLEYTLSEIKRSYEKTTVYKNKEILDNILYIGILQEIAGKTNDRGGNE